MTTQGRFDENARSIAKRQYFHKGDTQTPADTSLEDMFWRIANHVAGAEPAEERLKWAQEYYDLMAGKKFCPGGRIIAGAGTVHGQLLNCLQGDTIVETRQGQQAIRDLHGAVEVLSQDGVYRLANFRSFGEQELYQVTFSNGEVIEATAGHQWVHGKKLKGRYPRVTTLELEGRYVPIIPSGQRPERGADFISGLQHGIIFGYGSKNTEGETHHVRLFGEKRQLAAHFGSYRVRDAHYDGREQTIVQGMKGNLKALPDAFASDSYWYGFFIGLMATDGNVDDRGSSALFSSERAELEGLAAQLHRLGIKHASIQQMTQSEGRYGPRPCYVLRLIRQTMQPGDFIRDDQRRTFEASMRGNPRNASLQVISVQPTGRTEEVFCCEEPETNTFVVQGGYLTSNCFVQAATEQLPGSFEGTMEVAMKLALVTKVGGGNGVNLDPWQQSPDQRDAGIVGVAYMDAAHPDAEDFVRGLMRPPTQPDGDKQPVNLRNFRRVLFGEASSELRTLARAEGVGYARELPEGQLDLEKDDIHGVIQVPDDMAGIVQAARAMCRQASLGVTPRIDLTAMRREGSPIKGSGGTSSGPVSFLFEIFDNFLQWQNLGGEKSGPINTLRYIFAPVLRVVRQGGCLTGDTLIHTSTGALRLCELVDVGSRGWQQAVTDVATDEGWKRSGERFNNGVNETLRVTMSDGRSLQGTPNHKLKVLREDGQRQWVRFDELQPGDWTIQVLDQHTGTATELQPLHGERHFNEKAITTPGTLSEELALWLGYLWGDGFISGNRVGFSVAHGSPMDGLLQTLTARLFDLDLSRRQKHNDRSIILVTRSTALRDWLALNGLLKAKATDLDVPRAIRQAPRNILAAFLRGLFEADGANVHGMPHLSSASRQLINDVQILLGGLGIPSAQRTQSNLDNRLSKKPIHHLKVTSAEGSRRFQERIGWVAGSRLESLARFASDEARESSWPIPHATALLAPAHASLRKGTRGHPSGDTALRKSLSRYMRGERTLTRSGMMALQANGVAMASPAQGDAEEFYAQVHSVQAAGPALTLDISVDENHTYLAGGTVSHNSRRGAGMATIEIGHPDVLDFLTSKDLDREASEGDISTFNISILATNAFWEAKQRDGLWPLEPRSIPGKYRVTGFMDAALFSGWSAPLRREEGEQEVPLYRDEAGRGGVPARWLWHEIAQHAWATGEPGLIFSDRVNEHSALRNQGERYQIRSTNPCLRGDTEVITRSSAGLQVRDVRSLAQSGQAVQVWDGAAWVETTFHVTGRDQEVFTVALRSGQQVTATAYHTFILEDGTRLELRELRPGMTLKGCCAAVAEELERHGRDGRDQRAARELRHERDLCVVHVTPAGVEAEVYCCTVPQTHNVTLANGVVTGQCGEIPLTAGEPCDLGAINLAEYVRDQTFDFDTFNADVVTCVRFLDDVLDMNVFPLEQNREASQDLRRLGLGVMGLADALIKLGLRYDSQEGRDMIDRIMTALRETATAASQALGQERGNYPLYDRVKRRKNRIEHPARRNVAVLTVAPTGTTSMLFGVSSGIEPIYSPFIWRKIGKDYVALTSPLLQELLEQHTPPQELQSEAGGWDWEKVAAALSANHGTVQGLEWVPGEIREVLVCAHDIAPADHVRMQGSVQRAFDAGGELIGNSLSKTINAPNSATVEDIEAAYDLAYQEGCKGITVYRDGSRQFQVLSTSKSSEAAAPATELPEYVRLIGELLEHGQLALVTPRESGEPMVEAFDLAALRSSAPNDGSVGPKYPLPDRLEGFRDKVALIHQESAGRRSFMLNVGIDAGIPLELIITSGRAGDESNADSEALGRVISIALQYGVPEGAIISTLEGIGGGLFGTYRGQVITSKGALIAAVLREARKFINERAAVTAIRVNPPAGDQTALELPGAMKCPNCGHKTLVREEGCLKCYSCSFSKCG